MFVIRNKGEEKGTKRFHMKGGLPDDMGFEFGYAEISVEEFRG